MVEKDKRVSKMCERQADDLSDLLDTITRFPTLMDDYLSEDDLYVLGEAADILYDCARYLSPNSSF